MLNGLCFYKIITDEAGKAVDYVYLEANPAYKKMMNVESVNLIGKRVTEVFPGIKDCRFNWIENFGRVALEGIPLNVDEFFEPLQRWFSVHSFPTGEGGFATIFQDITESVTFEARIKKSEARFRRIFEKSPIGIFTQDLESLKFVDINEQILNTYGYTREELIGKSTEELNLIVDPVERQLLLKALLEKGSVQNFKLHVRHKNGGQHVILISTEIIEFEGKKHNIGMLNDVTDKKKDTERIKLQSNLLDAVGQAVIALNRSGNIIYANRAAEILYGYSKVEAIRKSPGEINAVDPEIMNFIMQVVAEGKSWQGELPLHKRDGTHMPVFITASPFFNLEGEYAGIISVHNDITEVKHREEQLRFEKEKAEEMNKLKSSMLTNMSHELRTPLAGIIGFSDILASTNMSHEQTEMIEVINSSGKRLLETLNLILELSRLEANEFKLNLSDFNVAQALGEEIRMFRGAAIVKNLELSVHLEDKDIRINSDRRMFSNVISNLLSNAVKFTRSGTINVKLFREDSSAVIEIADTGIGISENNLEKIFEPFRQASEGYDRGFEGTGLGLTLTQKCLEILHGSISVKSKKDEGSVFTVKLPVRTG